MYEKLYDFDSGLLVNYDDVIKKPNFISSNKSDDDVYIVEEQPLSVKKYKIYKPVVFYSSFGKDEIFEMLELSLKSLEISGYIGDVFIITDNDGSTKIDNIRIKNLFQNINVDIFKFEAVDYYDYTFARYLSEFSKLIKIRGYVQILYMDVDCIVDGNLSRMIIDNIDKNKFLACSEGRLNSDSNYWGGSIARNDPYYKEINLKSFNSGVLLFNSADYYCNIAELMSAIKLYLISKDFIDAGHKIFYDQPVLNYLLLKYGDFEDDLDSYVRLVNFSVPQFPLIDDRFCISHFHGGVGVYDKKLPAMTIYFNNLIGKN